MRRIKLFCSVLLVSLFTKYASHAQLIPKEEGERQSKIYNSLKISLSAQKTNAERINIINKALQAEKNVDFRLRIIELASNITGPERESFYINLVNSDNDAGIRSRAVTAIGKYGSDKCLDIIAKVAADDKVTSMQIGCIASESSARRAATFAIAELAGRFPALAKVAETKIRSLPAITDVKDTESLADARIQALYQITQNKELLKPFYDRLKSRNAKERENGVIAFRFLKIKVAPIELTGMLKDENPDVRSWTALVLGEIGDPNTAGSLVRIADNPKENRFARCNAIDALGRMKYAPAATLMEKLLQDADPAIPGNAAIALYRITGKKVKQFPEGMKINE